MCSLGERWTPFFLEDNEHTIDVRERRHSSPGLQDRTVPSSRIRSSRANVWASQEQKEPPSPENIVAGEVQRGGTAVAAAGRRGRRAGSVPEEEEQQSP